MHVDTGVFEALTERVTNLADSLDALAVRVGHAFEAEEVLRRAQMPEAMRRAADREARRKNRHLKAVH